MQLSESSTMGRVCRVSVSPVPPARRGFVTATLRQVGRIIKCRVTYVKVRKQLRGLLGLSRFMGTLLTTDRLKRFFAAFHRHSELPLPRPLPRLFPSFLPLYKPGRPQKVAEERSEEIVTPRFPPGIRPKCIRVARYAL